MLSFKFVLVCSLPCWFIDQMVFVMCSSVAELFIENIVLKTAAADAAAVSTSTFVHDNLIFPFLFAFTGFEEPLYTMHVWSNLQIIWTQINFMHFYAVSSRRFTGQNKSFMFLSCPFNCECIQWIISYFVFAFNISHSKTNKISRRSTLP